MSSAVAALTFAVSHYYIRDLIGLSLHKMVHALNKSFIVALCSAIAPLAVNLYMEVGPGNTWTPLLTAGLGTVIAWIGSILVLKHPVYAEASFIRQKLLAMVRGRRAGLPIERNQ